MPNCPICQTPFEIGAKYCSKCGCNLEKEYIVSPVCPLCGKQYPNGARFCDIDGAKLASREMLIPRCFICGKTYDSDTKFCPVDGGRVQTEYERMGNLSYTKEIGSTLIKAPNGLRFVAYLLDAIITSLLSIPTVIFYFMGMNNIVDEYDGSSAIFLC